MALTPRTTARFPAGALRPNGATQADLDIEEAARIAADLTERTQRIAADGLLSAAINNEHAQWVAAIFNLDADITTEILARNAGDAALGIRVDDLEDALAAAVIGEWDPPVEILDNTFTAQRHISTLGGAIGAGAGAFELPGGRLFSESSSAVRLTSGTGLEGAGFHVYRNGLRFGSPVRADTPSALFEVLHDNIANPKVLMNNLRLTQLGDPTEILLVGGGGENDVGDWEQYPSTRIGTPIAFLAWHNYGLHTDDELSLQAEFDTIRPMHLTGGSATFDAVIWQHPTETVPVFTDGRRLHVKFGATPPVTGSTLRVLLGDGTVVGNKSIRRDSGSSTLTGYINANAEVTLVYHAASDTLRLATDNGSDDGGDGVTKSASNVNPFFDRSIQIGGLMAALATGISQPQTLVLGTSRVDLPAVRQDIWLSITGGGVAAGKTTYEDHPTPFGFRSSIAPGQLPWVGSDLTDPLNYDPIAATSPGYSNPTETVGWANWCIPMSDESYWPGLSLRDAASPDSGLDFTLDRAAGLVNLRSVKRGTNANVITAVSMAPSGWTRLEFGSDHDIAHESLVYVTGLEFKDIVGYHEDRVMTAWVVDPRHVDLFGTRHDEVFSYSIGGSVYAEAKAVSQQIDTATGKVGFPQGLEVTRAKANGTDVLTLADDIAGSITLPSASGFIFLEVPGTNHAAILRYRTDTPVLTPVFQSADVVLTTGILANGDGTDVKLNVSIHTDGKIYFSNRVGASASISYMLADTI